MGKDRAPEFTTGLPIAGKVPRSLREKMELQTSHQRGRDGAARKRTLMMGPVFNSTRMSPQQLNADEKAVNFELSASGHILKGHTLVEQAIDPTDPIVSKLVKEPSVLTDPDFDPARHDPMNTYRSILEDEVDTGSIGHEVAQIFIRDQEAAIYAMGEVVNAEDSAVHEDLSEESNP